jgi:ornithine carbamoyltransferase
MDKDTILAGIQTLSTKNIDNMYLNDFLLTWDKSEDEVSAVFQTAEALRAMRTDNIFASDAHRQHLLPGI